MSAKIKELREKQKNLITLARQKFDEIKDDTPEARAKEIEADHDKIMADHDKIGEQIAREQRMVDAEQRHKESIEADDKRTKERRPNAGDSEGEETEEKREGKKPTEKRVFKKIMQFGAASLNEEERAIAGKLMANVTPEMRAQAAGTNSAGGYTVPQGFSGEIDKAMLAWGPMLDPGITRQMDTETGNLIPWPTMDDTGNVGALLAENVQAGAQDITFGSVNMNAWMYTSKIVLVSLQLLQDSFFDLDNEILQPAFGERLGRIVNTHLTTGAGSGSSQPNGIVTAAGLGATTAGVGAVTADELIGFYHSVDPAYRSSPKFRFMFNDSTLQAVRKLKDSQNRYLIEGLKDNGATLNLAGISVPYSINQAMASMATGNKFMIAGDLSRYVVRRVREMTMLRLVERYADFLQVGFLAFARYDGNLINTSAVKYMKNA